jgi:molybdenum cofactor biosynthesis protein A
MSNSTLTDSYGRTIRYLRLSVTDRCNLRCFYCMPKQGIEYVEKESLLTYEEMFRIVSVLSDQGVNKVRITGGEPFARRNLMFLLRKLANLPSVRWHMTTNGVLIKPYIKELASLGITSVNLSLDALDRGMFHQITRRDEFNRVYENMMNMIESGIRLKINCVVMKGRNEDQLLPLARLAKKFPVEVRFIEEMPFNGSQETHPVINHIRILEILKSEFPDLQRNHDNVQTAELYTSASLIGEIGIIPAFSRTFCGSCDRLRISATGDIRTCLYGKNQTNLLKVLRGGGTDEDLINVLRAVVGRKERNGFEAEQDMDASPNTSMSILGG